MSNRQDRDPQGQAEPSNPGPRPALPRTPWEALIPDPRSSSFAALLSVLAIVAAFLLGLFLGPERHDEGFLPATGLSAALVASRYLALRFRTGPWIVLVDAVVTLVAVSITSAPHSEFHFVALAGIWWAGRLVPRHGAALYALAFLVPYALVVLPGAFLGGALAEAAEDFLTIVVLALLVDWFMAVDRRVLQLGRVLNAGIAQGDSPLELRSRLGVAAGDSPLPIDTLVLAGRLGLRADEVELLGYLVLGFGNAQIAEAIGRSEATVRYRLTGLYRSLGVRGRREAILRARELGFDGILGQPPDRA